MAETVIARNLSGSNFLAQEEPAPPATIEALIDALDAVDPRPAREAEDARERRLYELLRRASAAPILEKALADEALYGEAA